MKSALIANEWCPLSNLEPPEFQDGIMPTGLLKLQLAWSLASPQAPPALHAVHVWFLWRDRLAAQCRELELTLAPEERSRAARLHFAHDRKRFVIGRGMLRRILGLYLELEPSQIVFHYDAHKKPKLSSNPGGEWLRFNVSHSGELALVAVTFNSEIGLDIERILPMQDLETVAGGFFSAREMTQLRALPDHQRLEAFYNCWTRKEACLKATGDGLGDALHDLEVTFVPGEPARLLSIAGNSDAATRFLFHSFQPFPGFIAAVALKR